MAEGFALKGAGIMADESGQRQSAEAIDANSCKQNGSTNGTSNPNEGDCIEEEPKRQITQTDHLNKRLLDSFLQRINQAGGGVPVVERISTSDNEEEEPGRDNDREADSNKL